MDARKREDCAICFDQVKCRGKLSVCDHWFCFSCIYEWSKHTNTCPLCKKTFRCVVKTHLLFGKSPEQKIRVRDTDRRGSFDDELAHENDDDEDGDNDDNDDSDYEDDEYDDEDDDYEDEESNDNDDYEDNDTDDDDDDDSNDSDDDNDHDEVNVKDGEGEDDYNPKKDSKHGECSTSRHPYHLRSSHSPTNEHATTSSRATTAASKNSTARQTPTAAPNGIIIGQWLNARNGRSGPLAKKRKS